MRVAAVKGKVEKSLGGRKEGRKVVREFGEEEEERGRLEIHWESGSDWEQKTERKSGVRSKKYLK